MPTLTTDERRRRLVHRHHLATPAPTALDAAAALVALHATDASTVFLSVAARTRDVTSADVEAALYDARSLVRLLVMRRTMFVLPRDAAAVAFAACTGTIARQERNRLLKHLGMASGLTGDLDAWLSAVEDATVAALEAAGEATANELADAVEGLRVELNLLPDKPYGGTTRITTRVLGGLAAQGRIVRGRPTGSLVSSRYRWAPLRAWLPEGLPAVPARRARAELVRRYLARFGPATLDDTQWWTGLTRTQVRDAFADTHAVTVDLDDGTTGHVLPGDTEATPDPAPGAALLPALDPTPMGWKARAWFLGRHEAPLFDRTGNIGPTVWWDGRVVGGWAQRADGEVVVRLLEDPGEAAREAVATEADRLRDWLGEARVTPRFRTPLEKQLADAK